MKSDEARGFGSVPNAWSIVRANVGFMAVLSLAFVVSTSVPTKAYVLALSLMLSAAYVAFGLIPPRWREWRSILASMAFAILTEAAVVMVFALLTGTRALIIVHPDWALPQTVAFFAGLYGVMVVGFVVVHGVFFSSEGCR